jgi:hypothetical protein
LPEASPQVPPPLQYPDSLPPLRDTFGIHWAALLAVVPFAAIRWVAAGPLAEARGMAGDAANGYRLGTVLWGLAFATALAWVGFRLAGRRRAMATAVFIGVYGLFTFGYMGRALLAVGPSRAAAGTTAGTAPGGAIDLSQAPVEPAPAPPREAFDRATAALRAAQAKTTEPTQRWAASGAFNLSAIRTAQDLDRRIEVLEALGKATRDARLESDNVLQKLRGELIAAGNGSPVQRELWAAQWATEVKIDDDRQVMLAVEKFLGAGRVQLRLLREQWGRWYLDRSTEQVTFDDAALQDRFARGARQVTMAEADLNEALRRAKKTNK